MSDHAFWEKCFKMSSGENFLPRVLSVNLCSLRKHAYLYILRILLPKNENFQMKNSDIFVTPALAWVT